MLSFIKDTWMELWIFQFINSSQYIKSPLKKTFKFQYDNIDCSK